MIWLVVTGVVLVVGVVVVLAVARGAQMSPAYDDRREVRLPQGRQLRSDDLAGTRFTLALRGYRMSEVDALLDRLRTELAERDHRPGRHEPYDVTAQPPSAPDRSGVDSHERGWEDDRAG